MVGVAEDDLGPGALHVAGAEAAHDAVGADRHEGGCAHLAVREGEGARARGALGGIEVNSNITPAVPRAPDPAAVIRRATAGPHTPHTITIASPYE